MVTHVQIVDLDQDGLVDVLYFEGRKNSVRWIRQSSRGDFVEQIIAEDIPGPAHARSILWDRRKIALLAEVGSFFCVCGRKHESTEEKVNGDCSSPG